MNEQYKHLRGLPVKSFENIKLQLIIRLNNKNVASLKNVVMTLYGTRIFENKVAWNTSLQLYVCECHDDVALQKLMKQYMQLEDYD